MIPEHWRERRGTLIALAAGSGLLAVYLHRVGFAGVSTDAWNYRGPDWAGLGAWLGVLSPALVLAAAHKTSSLRLVVPLALIGPAAVAVTLALWGDNATAQRDSARVAERYLGRFPRNVILGTPRPRFQARSRVTQCVQRAGRGSLRYLCLKVDMDAAPGGRVVGGWEETPFQSAIDGRTRYYPPAHCFGNAKDECESGRR